MKRFDWLDRMIKEHDFTIGAEVGSGTGKTAMELLTRNPELFLIQVAWYPNTGLHDAGPKAKNLWQKRIRTLNPKQIKIIQKPSNAAVKSVKDDSLDFVFIDADHSYEHCLQDIRIWKPKVRKGGLISGHDYNHTDYPGVKQAVLESFGNCIQAPDRVWYIWNS